MRVFYYMIPVMLILSFVLCTEELRESRLSAEETGRVQVMQDKVEEMADLLIPYRWGGTTLLGMDCSGAMQYLARAGGYALPRTSMQQFLYVCDIDDLVLNSCFVYFDADCNGKIDHTGFSPGAPLYHATPKRGFHKGKFSSFYQKIYCPVR